MRKNRAYKKNEPFRDARLFIIACEGEKREKLYFELLSQGSKRLKVQILAAEQGTSLSAPKWVVDRLVNYIEKEGVNINLGDIVWLVMDVDQWEIKDLIALASACREEKWGFALSNPCFEVWLWMHVAQISDATSLTCKEFKRELNEIVKGGYNVETFLKRANHALEQAKAFNDDIRNPIPALKFSRVHLPVKEIMDMF